ncbi:MAG: methyltransferase, partial [Magnetococcales bacterium]|nr:methyltransferase [Magnetococcales bacterium]
AGLTGVTIDKWETTPWQVMEGIEFRSVTLTAVKHSITQQTEGGHAILYRGPFACVEDDLGNRFPVGVRMAVSREAHARMGCAPFVDHVVRFAPLRPQLPTPYLAPPGAERPASAGRGGQVQSVGQGERKPCGPAGGGGKCC